MARKNSKSRTARDDAPDELEGLHDPQDTADETEEAAPEAAKPVDPEDDTLFPRDKELGADGPVREQLIAIYDEIEVGFQDQIERANAILDYWDLYNSKLGPNQFYNGNSQVFIPIIMNAVNARKTRFSNQLFPPSGRYIEVTCSEAKPTALMSLLENYVRRSRLRTKIIPALLKSGDIEGQYTIYAGWQERKRRVAYRHKVPTADESTGSATGEEHDDIKEETLTTGAPYVEIVPDTDLLVLPATSSGIYEALDNGGSVTVLRRWSKAKVKQMRRKKEITAEAADMLLAEFTVVARTLASGEKYEKAPDAAGIHVENAAPYALIYETWAMLDIGNHQLLCRMYYGGNSIILSARRNPYWSDRCPIFSSAVEVVEGCFKGKSLVEPCATLQYAANDAVNEAMDSAAYALMPIIMTDPAKNPRVGSMVLNMAAIWEVDPQSTQFAKFPDIWKEGFEIVNAHKQEIFQTLNVSPAIMPQMSQTHVRMNQAEIANEQQVDLLTTADSTTIIEEAILTPLINFFAELDHQYRSKPITVRQFGEMGIKANMESVPVIQFDTRYEFRWFGVEQARNSQAIQQQISAMNVVRGIPPQQYQGYTLDLVPVILQLVENTFGPRIAPQIFKSMKDQLAVPVQLEDQLMVQGFDVPVHPADNDAEHLQDHLQAMRAAGDDYGTFREHIMRHIVQAQMKAAQQAQMPGGPMAQGEPGIPGGAGPGGPQPAPGVAGTPRIGAQPQMPRGGQNPPGAIHRDQLRDASAAPRMHNGRGQ